MTDKEMPRNWNQPEKAWNYPLKRDAVRDSLRDLASPRIREELKGLRATAGSIGWHDVAVEVDRLAACRG